MSKLKNKMCIPMNILFLANKNMHLQNINDRRNLKSCYPHVRGVHFSDLAKHDNLLPETKILIYINRFKAVLN